MMRQKQLIHYAISLVSLLCETLKLGWHGGKAALAKKDSMQRERQELYGRGDQDAHKERLGGNSYHLDPQSSNTTGMPNIVPRAYHPFVSCPGVGTLGTL